MLFNIYLNFILYSYILYLLFSMFFIPFFWNIFYFRFLKQNYNDLIENIYSKKVILTNFCRILNLYDIDPTFVLNLGNKYKFLFKSFLGSNVKLISKIQIYYWHVH